MTRFKKGDRVEATVNGQTIAAIVTKAGAKMHAHFDDGRRLVGAESQFRPSSKPLPEDSPFANPITERPARVRFTSNDGETIEGVLVKGNRVEAVVRSGNYEYQVSQAILSRSEVVPPVDDPSPMDAWGVKSYKPNERLSEETTAFTATITLDGKRALDASNHGTGGCNAYHGPYTLTDRLHKDAEAWARQFGDDNPFEAADTWLQWASEHKPLGITATEFMQERKESLARMLGDTPGL